MKRLLVLAGVVALLCSCAGLPEPEGEGNSLVIGGFVLDFPDGFFREQPRAIQSSVTLAFRNVTKNTSFTLSTDTPGMFCFVTNGSDEYLFESFSYRDSTGTGRHTIGETPIKLKILTVPGRIIYLGHLTVRYGRPKLIGATGASDENRTFDYDVSSSLEWNRGAVLSYIEKKNPKSGWRNVQLVDYRKK